MMDYWLFVEELLATGCRLSATGCRIHFDTDIEKFWLGACACFALGVPKAVQVGCANHHPQKRHLPRQAGLVQFG